MDTVAPADPNPPTVTITDIFFQLGFLGLIFVLVALVLLAWLIVLFLRERPMLEHFAYIAATTYPFFLGILGGSLSAAHLIWELGNNGISNPEPRLLAQCLAELLWRLIVGSGLTCLFLPLGILALLLRVRTLPTNRISPL
jgi:hypothetical protein